MTLRRNFLAALLAAFGGLKMSDKKKDEAEGAPSTEEVLTGDVEQDPPPPPPPPPGGGQSHDPQEG